MIHFVSGNILDAKVEALVNPVNTAGVMGKGLALQFKKAFPANFEAYRAAAKAGELRVGKLFVFEVGGSAFPRTIINFPTNATGAAPRSSSMSQRACKTWWRWFVSVRCDRSQCRRWVLSCAVSRGTTCAR